MPSGVEQGGVATGDRGSVWLTPPPASASGVEARHELAMRRLLLSSPLGRPRRRCHAARLPGPAHRSPAQGARELQPRRWVPMAFTSAPWRLNFEGEHPVTVTHRARVFETTGKLLPMTPPEMGRAVRTSLDNGGYRHNGWGSGRHAGHDPTATERGARHLPWAPPSSGSTSTRRRRRTLTSSHSPSGDAHLARSRPLGERAPRRRPPSDVSAAGRPRTTAALPDRRGRRQASGGSATWPRPSPRRSRVKHLPQWLRDEPEHPPGRRRSTLRR